MVIPSILCSSLWPGSIFWSMGCRLNWSVWLSSCALKVKELLPSFIDQVIFCYLRDILGEDSAHSFKGCSHVWRQVIKGQEDVGQAVKVRSSQSRQRRARARYGIQGDQGLWRSSETQPEVQLPVSSAPTGPISTDPVKMTRLPILAHHFPPTAGRAHILSLWRSDSPLACQNKDMKGACV